MPEGVYVLIPFFAPTPPWFAFRFSPDGAKQQERECLYCHRKVKEAGFACATVGIVGHRFPVTVLPGAPGTPGEDGPRFVFDGELARRGKGTRG